MLARLDDIAAQATARSLEDTLAELETLPESTARTLAFDAVDALLQLYGEGLARIVAVHQDGRLSDEFLGRDAVLAQLLAIHGLASPERSEPLVQIERRRSSSGFDDRGHHERSEGSALASCQLCAAPITPEHRHLLDLERRELTCACGACAILFDAHGAAGHRYRLIPRRYRALDSAIFDDGVWDRLALPVDVAFMFMSSSANRPVAFYPGPMGTTESALPLPSWDEIVARAPVLATIEPDVEAILIHRARGARDYWLVPVDECYRLAGAMRATWQGISGGDAMRAAVAAFFQRMNARTERTEDRCVTT
ncbi:MAG TPA: DUF5947 family protein [Gemmatimonadaceae bacterium]